MGMDMSEQYEAIGRLWVEHKSIKSRLKTIERKLAKADSRLKNAALAVRRRRVDDLTKPLPTTDKLVELIREESELREKLPEIRKLMKARS